MKLTTSHLDALKGLLTKTSSQLSDQTKVAKAAEDRRLQLDAQNRAAQAAFDIAASAFASDSELSVSQMESLNPAAQAAIGYVREKTPEPVPAEPEAPSAA
jgi:hypothetical protein